MPRIAKLAIAVFGAVALMMGGAAVYAVASPGDATITACAQKATGAMRLSTNGTCKSSETMVAWNQAGVPGADGVTGYERSLTEGTYNPSGATRAVTLAAGCPSGKKVLSGGAVADLNGSEGQMDVIEGMAISDSVWRFTLANRDGGALALGDAVDFQMTLVCASVN